METNLNEQDFWKVIAFSDELRKEHSVQRKIAGIPVLLWRDINNKVHAVANVCQHKRAPLNVSCFSKNELTCPYHGWKYNCDGALIEIPSATDLDRTKLNGRLQRYRVEEVAGNIWILMGEKEGIGFEEVYTATQLSGHWKTHSLHAKFQTNVEPLIDNFMDATHTAFTHKGIIRGHGEKVKHTVQVISNAREVRAEFAPTLEKIAVGLRLFLGKNISVRHTDTFLLPNMVRVDYFFNEVHRFNAFIVCTQISEGETRASIRLSYNFPWLNPIVGLFLPRLARKVISQDMEVTAMQYQNQCAFPDQNEHLTECDLIHERVKMLRRAALEERSVTPSETTIQFYL